jgi:hypothetical protein
MRGMKATLKPASAGPPPRRRGAGHRVGVSLRTATAVEVPLRSTANVDAPLPSTWSTASRASSTSRSRSLDDTHGAATTEELPPRRAQCRSTLDGREHDGDGDGEDHGVEGEACAHLHARDEGDVEASVGRATASTCCPGDRSRRRCSTPRGPHRRERPGERREREDAVLRTAPHPQRLHRRPQLVSLPPAPPLEPPASWRVAGAA